MLLLNLRWVYGIGACTISPAIEHVATPAKTGGLELLETEKTESTDLSIIVVGASGELARNKIFPALFALFYEDRLPKVNRAALFALQF